MFFDNINLNCNEYCEWEELLNYFINKVDS